MLMLIEFLLKVISVHFLFLFASARYEPHYQLDLLSGCRWKSYYIYLKPQAAKGMTYKSLIALFVLILTGFTSAGQSIGSMLDKEKLYSAMSSEDLGKVNQQLKRVEPINSIEGEAFEGALLMKKAGLLKGAKEKLSVFKEGNKKLERSIDQDSINPEYRFLRLIIQENAPKILNYNKDLKTDQSILISKFKELPAPVKDAVLNYSKNSKVLKTTDFK
jgi:hypothetical protein